MNAKQWTPEQEAAIVSRGEILVAAAAGSGKTAVLVERLLRRIVDRDHPVDIERFLVVTFTKAAAQEMRERVRKTLEENLFAAEEGFAEVLLRQLNRLPLANIATLHSFCLDLIRRYFYLLALDPAFRIADEGEIELLRQDVLEEVLEENYVGEDPRFQRLVEAFGSDRDDQSLMAEVLRLYDFANSQVRPGEWLDTLAAGYVWPDGETLWESPWGEAVRQGVADRLQMALSYLQEAERLAGMPGGPNHYLSRLQEERAGLADLLQLTQRGNWQTLQEGLLELTFGRLPNRRKGVETEIDCAWREQAKGLRDEVKKIVLALKEELSWDVEAQIRGLQATSELITSLVKFVQEFSAAFAKAKRQRNVLDFADLEHMAYRLLREERWGIAVSLQDEFVEVLVDEYQDINAIQEGILRQVARPQGNRFMVGDVKQSIYRFRMADPGLFLAKYKEFPHFPQPSCPEGGAGQVIDLSRNFRSRAEIIDGINFLFRQIMTEGAGEIAYDESAALIHGAAYADSQSGLVVSDGPIEVHLIEGRYSREEVEEGSGAGIEGSSRLEGSAGVEGSTGTGSTWAEPNSGAENRFSMETEEAEELEGMRREANVLAQRLHAMVEAKEFQVLDTRLREYRPLRYGDIVILLRSYSANALIFQEELERAGIPVFAETGSGYFAANEVETVLSLLKVIDNPHQDIPLAAVLRSPLAGFSGGELGKLRVLLPQGDFYEALAVAAAVGAGSAEAAPSAAVELEASKFQWIQKLLQAYMDGQEQLQASALNLPRELQEKAAKFWNKLERWREYAKSHPLSELLARIYAESLYLAYSGTLPNGKQRQANLQALYDRALRFEETRYRGLFRFLRFLERFQGQGKDLGQAKVLGENEDVVRVMTVHASKGLEFPVVFVAGLGKKFNLRSLAAKTLLHPRLGIGVPILDVENKVRYPSVIHQAVRQQLLDEALAEELRILYVALTRAKEKLLLYGSVPNLERALEHWQQAARRAQGTFSDAQLRAARSFLDWIGAALARHPDQPLGPCAGDETISQDASRWQVVLHQEAILAAFKESTQAEPEPKETPAETEERVARVRADKRYSGCEDEAAKVPWQASTADRLGWVYPFSVAATRVAKTSVSALKKRSLVVLPGEEPEEREGREHPGHIFARPKFLEAQVLTPAEKGTALHIAMQHLPLAVWQRADFNTSRQEEMEDLLRDYIKDWEAREILSRQQCQALPLTGLFEFVRSPLGQRMFAASEVWREVPFTLALPTEAGEVPQLVQGVIDALIFTPEGDAVELVDYKTDRLDPEGAEDTLRARYGMQLGYYTWAVESLLQIKVKRATLYAFSLGKEIPCEPVWLRELVLPYNVYDVKN